MYDARYIVMYKSQDGETHKGIYILMGINYDSTSYITNESSPHVAGGKEKRRKKKKIYSFFLKL